MLDVEEFFKRGVIQSARLRSYFEQIRPALSRFPAIDVDDFANKVDEVLKNHEG